MHLFQARVTRHSPPSQRAKGGLLANSASHAPLDRHEPSTGDLLARDDSVLVFIALYGISPASLIGGLG
jgi:hypothetical protein